MQGFYSKPQPFSTEFFMEAIVGGGPDRVAAASCPACPELVEGSGAKGQAGGLCRGGPVLLVQEAGNEPAEPLAVFVLHVHEFDAAA